MIGVLFATEKEAAPLIARGVPDGVCIKVAEEMGLEAARIAAEDLVADGATAIINAGVCGGLHNRVERGAVYRISTVVTEELKAAVNVGVGVGLKKLVSVETPLYEADRKRELARQYDVVDMEGYAVARVCEAHEIPCLILKGVTDFGDAQASAEIQEHIGPVSETVAEAVVYALEGMLSRASSANKIATEPEGFGKKLHRFTKVEHIVFSLPLLFAGAWLGADGWPPLSTLLWIILAGVGARTMGMALNRIFDRHIDAKNPRTALRELAAGTLSVGQGIGIALIGLLFYLVACYGLGPLILKLSLFPLIPLVIYSLLKRCTPLCHFGIGVALFFAPLGAYTAVSGQLQFTPEIILLSLFTFLWISGFDIIYALLDLDFDRSHGVKSLPAAVGARAAQGIAAVVHMLSFALLVLLWMEGGGVFSFLALLVAAVAFGLAYKQSIPIAVRFFPISAIAGISGALVVLLGGLG